LLEPETDELVDLVDHVADKYDSAQDSDFLRFALLLAHELPRSLRAFLLDARDTEEAGAYLVSASGVIGTLGHTPRNWWSAQRDGAGRREEMALVLLASVFGEVFGWATQQDGRMVHDVVPTAGHEDEQLGSSSLTELTWHTEDAFHDSRADYLGLACLRNPYAASTSLFCNSQLTLDAADLACLQQERFVIIPDNSHKPAYNPGLSDDDPVFQGVLEKLQGTRPVAALFGDPAAPYLRVDPEYMTAAPGDTEASDALRRLFAMIESRIVDVALLPGDFIFVDNYRCVHGRRPFTARYDGTDRWLKRVNITRDFRRARVSRASLGYRVVR
jgi:Fe(II)/alpha-ketoglutarate-dependent arginine beta-hydroxylase